MGKKVHKKVLDSALKLIQRRTNLMTVCDGEPYGFFDATEGNYSLGGVEMSPSDFAISDGDISGRKLTVSNKSSVNVRLDGTATHVALLDTKQKTLLYVTTCTSQELTTGNSITFPKWDIEIADPS